MLQCQWSIKKSFQFNLTIISNVGALFNDDCFSDYFCYFVVDFCPGWGRSRSSATSRSFFDLLRSPVKRRAGTDASSGTTPRTRSTWRESSALKSFKSLYDRNQKYQLMSVIPEHQISLIIHIQERKSIKEDKKWIQMNSNGLFNS